jgi:hypothetical protein
LPLSAFNRAGDGHQWWCRECFRAYFKARGELHLEQVRRGRDRRRNVIRELVIEHLIHNPCLDCGETDLRVLEFDHVGSKEAEVSLLLNRGSRNEAVAEIARCEVVCANCHRRRTATRSGWRRLTEARPWKAGPRERRDRNVQWVYKQLRESACADCGIRDPLVLEHDHIGEKRANVMALAWDEYSLETLEREIAACEVRCCNCHRRRTATRRDDYRARAVTSNGPP